LDHSDFAETDIPYEVPLPGEQVEPFELNEWSF
jgi:hypothetical protein